MKLNTMQDAFTILVMWKAQYLLCDVLSQESRLRHWRSASIFGRFKLFLALRRRFGSPRFPDAFGSW